MKSFVLDEDNFWEDFENDEHYDSTAKRCFLSDDLNGCSYIFFTSLLLFLQRCSFVDQKQFLENFLIF